MQGDDFLTAKGLGNEVPFRIFDYPPENELLVRRTINMIASKLNSMSVNILVIDLYYRCLKLLEVNGLWKKSCDSKKTRVLKNC